MSLQRRALLGGLLGTAAVGLLGCGSDGTGPASSGPATSGPSPTDHTTAPTPGPTPTTPTVPTGPRTGAAPTPLPSSGSRVREDLGGFRCYSTHPQVLLRRLSNGRPEELTAVSPVWVFSHGVLLYQMPRDVRPEDRPPRNGFHGYFMTVDQLPEPTDVRRFTIPRGKVTFAKQRYQEFTNFQTDYTDLYGFVEWDVPNSRFLPTLTVTCWKYGLTDQDFEAFIRGLERNQ